MFGILITIGLIVLAWKLCGWCLKICGKLIGGIFSMIGYILIAVLAVAGFGIAVFIIPVILVIGVMAIVSHLVAV